MKIKKPIVLIVIVLLIAAAVAVVAAVALSLGGDTPSDDTGALEKEPAKAPEKARSDLAGYMEWLPQYIRIPTYSIDDIYYTNALYLSARFAYENDLAVIDKAEDSFSAGRKDLVELFAKLSGLDYQEARNRVEGCYKYLSPLGDSYDPVSDSYTFKLERESWGESNSVNDTEKNFYLDPSKQVTITETDDSATVLAWVTYPVEDGLPGEGYYEAEFTFNKTAAFDHTVYQLVSVRYTKKPIEVSDMFVGTTQDEAIDGFYTEFILTVRDRQKEFTGRSRADLSHGLMNDPAIEYQDLTGDGYYDIIVLFDLYEDLGPYEVEHRESVHVFDGETLEEYPVSDIMADLLNAVSITETGDSYAFDIAGERYAIEKTEYDKYPPDLTTSYHYNTYIESDSIFLYVDCVTGGNGVNYHVPAHLLARVDFIDGEFVLGDITFEENRGDASYNFCEVHASGYHHGLGGSFLCDIVGEENYEKWMYDTGEEQYENNGCTEAGNIYNFAVHFGLTQKQLKDNYYLYSYDYYWNYPDPTPLFEMDEKGCDEFFRDLDMKAQDIMQCRNGEYDFKNLLLEGMLESDDPVKRTAYYKFNIEGNNSRIPFWSIAELVYEAELTLEELEALYDSFAEGREKVFEYDFERLFTDRDHFEELIKTAEYPVFVDEALHK